MRLILFLSFIFFSTIIYSQSASISGYVKDTKNQPLEGTSVFLKNTQYKSNSDKNGFFSLKNIPSGEYTIVVESINSETINNSFIKSFYLNVINNFNI